MPDSTPQPTRVLLAEDDLNLGQVLSEYLTLKGFDVQLYRDGQAAWAGYCSTKPELCILDVMMPKEDGFAVARRIREIDKSTPVIFLTAKNMQEDRIQGFMIGGDDYITKPFSMQELLLRIQAILRRLAGSGSAATDTDVSQPVHLGSMVFTPATRKLKCEAEEIQLTNKEARLLHLLSLNLNNTLTRTEALKQIWGEDSYYNARSMDVYIAKLRKILKRDQQVQILTVHGEGFKLIAG